MSKTISLIATPVTIFDDGTLDFTKLCQALGADPGVMASAVNHLLIVNENGHVISPDSLPEFVLSLQTSNNQVAQISNDLYNNIMSNIMKNYAAGTEDVATIQRRAQAKMTLDDLNSRANDLKYQIEQQKLTYNTALNPVSGETQMAANRRNQTANIAKMNLDNLTASLGQLQGEIDILQSNIEKIGTPPDPATNFLNALFGRLTPPAPAATAVETGQALSNEPAAN